MFRSRVAFAAFAGVTGYFLGCSNSGEGFYSPRRSQEYIIEQFKKLEQLKSLRNNPKYIEFDPNFHVREISTKKGAVHETAYGFRNKEDKLNTISFLFCGPLSIGFPKMVHGGLISTILRQTAHSALESTENGVLDVRYLRPTKIDQILRVESHISKLDKNCLELVVFAKDENLPLVRARYYKN